MRRCTSHPTETIPQVRFLQALRPNSAGQKCLRRAQPAEYGICPIFRIGCRMDASFAREAVPDIVAPRNFLAKGCEEPLETQAPREV
jgi:hypothetical protein